MPLRDIFKASEPSDVEAAQRRVAIAQALQQRAMQPNVPASGGPVQAAYSPGTALVDLANALASAWGVKNAEAAYGRAKTAKEKAAADSLKNLIGGQQMNPPDDGVGPMPPGNARPARTFEQSLPLAQNAINEGANPALVQALLEQRKPPPKKLERVDVGNEVLVVDESGKVQQRLPKGNSPDAQLSAGTSRRGQDISAATAVRGQDITSRGQNLTADTTRRGQDITAATAIRGQDATTGKGAKPTEYDKKAKLLYGEMLDSEKQYRQASGTDTSSAYNAALNSNPVTRIFTSEDYRKHEASGMRWAQNFLYLKSGASAPLEEVRKTFVQYLPQPGDTDPVIEQKREAREQAMANVASANGLPVQNWNEASPQGQQGSALDSLMQRFLQPPRGP